MDRRAHWERVYTEKRPDQVSWYQAEARLSLDLISKFSASAKASVIDVGGGASRLVDGLLAGGYADIRVLDLSAAALAASHARLGAAGDGVHWSVDDVLTADFAPQSVDVWHDRAVFHFLTEAPEREAYVAQVRRAMRPDGIVLVATFAEDGPLKCSGLDVVRYSPDALHHEFGEEFVVIESQREAHRTPSGALQWFTYCLCRYEPPPRARQAA